MIELSKIINKMKLYTIAQLIRQTGLSGTTVAELKRGEQRNPRYDTYLRLIEWYKSRGYDNGES